MIKAGFLKHPVFLYHFGAVGLKALFNSSSGYPLQVLARLRFTPPGSGLSASIRQPLSCRIAIELCPHNLFD